VALAAFLVQPHPPALAVGKIILDPHGDDGANTGEEVGHDADQGAVAQADQSRRIDAVEEEEAGLVGRQHRGLTALDDVLGAAQGVGRVDGQHAAGDQPVEAHADRGEMPLDGRLRGRALQRLDIGGDMDRLDIGELPDLVALDPGEELRHRPVVRHPGVFVADGGGEMPAAAPSEIIDADNERKRGGRP